VSTQVPLHRVDVGAEQPVTQEYVLPEPEQTGAVVGHTTPQAPQFDVDDSLVSQPCATLALQ
jgi:hypothetical protein